MFLILELSGQGLSEEPVYAYDDSHIEQEALGLWARVVQEIHKHKLKISQRLYIKAFFFLFTILNKINRITPFVS